MDLNIRRTFTLIDDKRVEAGRHAETPLRKVAVIYLLENPYIGRYVEDLSPLIQASEGLGRQMAQTALKALDGMPVQSYGKGGVVGLSGEQDHANALLTTTFANPFREAIGGAQAWISSMTKVAAPGTVIDVPMNCKDDVYVRSHYDGMTLLIPEGPMPDEVAIIFCLGTGGRINARVGGLRYEDLPTSA